MQREGLGVLGIDAPDVLAGAATNKYVGAANRRQKASVDHGRLVRDEPS